jgi:hypothetical protein
MERARELARRYMSDLVLFHAGTILSPQSEAALHTRMLCAKEMRAIAFGIPQTVPEAPPPHDVDGDGSEAS